MVYAYILVQIILYSVILIHHCLEIAWWSAQVAMELATIPLDVVHYTAAFNSTMPWCLLLPLGVAKPSGPRGLKWI